MRYFLEVAYKGTGYAGFQVQQNANTIQGEVEKALEVVFRKHLQLTGSSRTDAGVHALQNFFHFDADFEIKNDSLYNINALLPRDIAVRSINKIEPASHCRFDATSREYKYFISAVKNPFAVDSAWFYPYNINIELLNTAAEMLFHYNDFTSFSKKNTQVFTNLCSIEKSLWFFENNLLVYNVIANRFLRGMVRGLVGTMLLVGRQKIALEEFTQIIEGKDCTKANFATPPHGLFLVRVNYPVVL